MLNKANLRQHYTTLQKHWKHFLQNMKWDKVGPFYSYSVHCLVRAMRQKEYKMGTNRKEETKLSLLADSMSLCSKNNTDTDRKCFDLMNYLSKVADTNQHIKK